MSAAVDSVGGACDGAAEQQPMTAHRITPTTLALFLLGRRDAILAIAGAPSAFWLGLLFVLSAGFAREYDGEDLLREPWHLGLPLVASLGTSLLLFSLVFLIARTCEAQNGSFLQLYRRFLTLYWMTAPLAWVYAVPVERFLSPGEAVRANLWFLAFVATWRVLLMTRVISILFRAPFVSALVVVMLFADAVLLTLLFSTPMPVFAVMGGVRLSESEAVIQSATFSAIALGLLSAPVWLLGTAGVAYSRKHPWTIAPELFSSTARSLPASWGLAALSLLIWLPILPATQAEQRLRTQVENDLTTGRAAAALATMSAHRREAFPPHWDPPPRIGYGENIPPIINVMEEIDRGGAADWVRTLFLEKFENYLVAILSPHVINPAYEEDRLKSLAIIDALPQPHRQRFIERFRSDVAELITDSEEVRTRMDEVFGPAPEESSLSPSDEPAANGSPSK